MDENATVAACQIRVADLEPESNLGRIADRLAGVDADVVLFPELALTGFVADGRIERAALSADSGPLDRVRDLARDHDAALVVGFAEDADGRYFNATAYVTPTGVTTIYRKRHLWGGEREVFAPGDERVTVDTPVGSTGLVTCYDLNFVTDSAAFAADGVDALFVVGAWPATHGQNWRLLVRARALDGVRWAIACGRTGRREIEGAPVVEYAGRSLVARPDGVVAAELAHGPDDLVVALDEAVLRTQRALVDVPIGAGDGSGGAGAGDERRRSR